MARAGAPERVAEAKEALEKAEKAVATTMFKWKPDYLAAEPLFQVRRDCWVLVFGCLLLPPPHPTPLTHRRRRRARSRRAACWSRRWMRGGARRRAATS